MENFFVVEASNGEVALKSLEENHIDLAIVDIMMPKMDGYQLIKKIRERYDSQYLYCQPNLKK